MKNHSLRSGMGSIVEAVLMLADSRQNIEKKFTARRIVAHCRVVAQQIRDKSASVLNTGDIGLIIRHNQKRRCGLCLRRSPGVFAGQTGIMR